MIEHKIETHVFVLIMFSCSMLGTQIPKSIPIMVFLINMLTNHTFEMKRREIPSEYLSTSYILDTIANSH